MIDARAVIAPQAEIGAGVQIGPFSIIGPDVVIGPGTWIGPHVVINGPTRIGAENKIFQFASIGDAPQDKKYQGEPTRLEIGDWVIVGGLTAVHQFAKIGAHAFLAGGAIVTRDVPPYVMVAGNPAAPHAVNSEGLKRRGFSEEQIRTIREAYRTVYRADLRLTEALERLAPQAESRPEIRAFVDFIQSSTRSLVR